MGGSCPALSSGHSVGSRRWSAGQVTTEKDSPPPRLEPTPPRAQAQGVPLFSEPPAPRVPPGESHADRGAGLCLGGARGKQTRRASGGGEDSVTECALSLPTWNQSIWTWDSKQRCVLTHDHLNHPAPPNQEAAKQGSRTTYAASW